MYVLLRTPMKVEEFIRDDEGKGDSQRKGKENIELWEDKGRLEGLNEEQVRRASKEGIIENKSWY